jgi:hypothetical protein
MGMSHVLLWPVLLEWRANRKTTHAIKGGEGYLPCPSHHSPASCSATSCSFSFIHAASLARQITCREPSSVSLVTRAEPRRLRRRSVQGMSFQGSLRAKSRGRKRRPRRFSRQPMHRHPSQPFLPASRQMVANVVHFVFATESHYAFSVQRDINPRRRSVWEAWRGVHAAVDAEP